MSGPASIRVSTRVDVDPDTAFAVFTEEIDTWWVRVPHWFRHPGRVVGVLLEPRVGGTLVAVHDAETGTGDVMARVTVFDPPGRLVLVDEESTEIEVRFEAADGGTRVTLEHRGLDRLAAAEGEHAARFGWRHLLSWFDAHLARRPTVK